MFPSQISLSNSQLTFSRPRWAWRRSSAGCQYGHHIREISSPLHGYLLPSRSPVGTWGITEPCMTDDLVHQVMLLSRLWPTASIIGGLSAIYASVCSYGINSWRLVCYISFSLQHC